MGYSACVAECTGVDGRACVTQTFDVLCPVEVYGTDRVITVNEVERCKAEALAAACWCGASDICWDPAMPMPLSCTPGGLCDPR